MSTLFGEDCSYTLLVEHKNLFANFFCWTAGHLMHTFPGHELTACCRTMHNFRGSVLEYVHTVTSFAPFAHCPSTYQILGPARPSNGPPSARPVWIKLCGVFISGIRASGEAHGVLRQHTRRPVRPSKSEASSRRRGDHAPFRLNYYS